MAEWWDLLGEYDAESTTFTALAGGAGSSPYTPLKDARMKKLRIVFNRSAATSLINHVQFRLSSGQWPVDTNIGGTGSGLQTAPALMSGDTATAEFDVDLPVKAGVPITIEARNVTADTPVTVSVLLYAKFQG